MVFEQEKVIIGQSEPQGAGGGIGPGPQGAPKSPPVGYVPLPKNEITPTIGKIAHDLLNGEFGTTTPFSIGNKRYMARLEPHYHPSPPAGCGTPALPDCDISKFPKPWGWHKGCTVYKAAEATTVEDYAPPTDESNPRVKWLQRIDDFYNALQKETGN